MRARCARGLKLNEPRHPSGRTKKAFFDRLATAIHVPGASTSLDPNVQDASWRSVGLRVRYDGHYLLELGELFKPFVLLEVGSAPVTPFVACDLTSVVHDELAAQGQAQQFLDNRPRGVRCVHPLVTLLEKLDALHRHVPRATREPTGFVRHFEDAAKRLSPRRSPYLPSRTMPVFLS